jgi:hypothetical protein
MSQIIPYFSVPFCFAQHPQPDVLNATLRGLFLAGETEGERFANPNPYTMRNVDCSRAISTCSIGRSRASPNSERSACPI